jgi:predicted small secreted protein
MYKRMTLTALGLVGLISLMSLLSACHTTAGAGEDISQTGKAIEKSAEKNTP